MPTHLRAWSFAVSLMVGLLPIAAPAQDQQDREGCADHPLIKRYPGSVIDECLQKAFEEYELSVGTSRDAPFGKTQHLEGKLTSIYYETPETRSALEIFRNYELALKNAGFATLFACAKTLCGGIPPDHLSPFGLGNYSEDEAHYVAAKLPRASGDIYVALLVYGTHGYSNRTILTMVESRPMETGLVTVNAAALAEDITRTGHTAVYGIYFDTGKWDVKPESDPALKAIATVLQQDAALKLHVVGHTDNVGELPMNLELSRKRAGAVVQILATKYGVAAARLRPDGVGPLAPVASNESEEGRAKNRRVELVKQ
jgi:OmpA-OmpF porin, OOP family